jgi:hypothetical protein
MPWELGAEAKLLSGVRVSASNLVSNQNSYDARRTQFLPKYYNYTQFGMGPEAKLVWGDERQPITWSASAGWSHRRYPHRPTQDASGTYQSATLDQDNWTFSTTLSYPMAPRFKLLFNLQHGRTESNQGFEQFYSYNYSATNYMFGFSYDY